MRTVEGDGNGSFESAAECIAAGMYWFGQSDLAAADAWWRRALELEPENLKAQECLRLLNRTSSTGFKQDSWARIPHLHQGSERPSSSGENVFDVPRADSDDSLDLSTDDLLSLDARDGSELRNYEAGPLDLVGFIEEASKPVENSGASIARDERSLSPNELVESVGAAIPAHSPWDDGPSRTSVITIRNSGEFDAVADPTPLPEIDRERFFNRGDPNTTDEIVDFLRASGELPEEAVNALRHSRQMTAAKRDLSAGLDADVLDEAVSTEPALTVSRTSPGAALQMARDSYQLHDFQGVVEALDDYPSDASHNTEVRNMLAEARSQLLRMYEAKIGSLEQVPSVLISNEEVIWLNLNHRAGFILSQVDGTVTYDDLISLSGMPRLDTVRILTELLDQKVIGVTYEHH